MVINRIIIIIISYKHGQSFDWFLFCKNCKYVAKFVLCFCIYATSLPACVCVCACCRIFTYKHTQTPATGALTHCTAPHTHTHPSSTYLHITYTSDSDSRGIKCITTISVNMWYEKVYNKKKICCSPCARLTKPSTDYCLIKY